MLEALDDRARRAEERYGRGQRVRPLEGLPVALKEETALEGWGNTFGSLAGLLGSGLSGWASGGFKGIKL